MTTRNLVTVSLVLAAALATCVAALAADTSLQPDQPAAKVNGKTITVGQLERECLARFGAGTLGQMVDYMIVDDAAAKHNIKITNEEILARIQQIQASIDSQGRQTGLTFPQWAAAHRLSMRELIAQTRMQLQLEKMVSSKVNVTDAEVATYYQANQDKFRQPERMLISHIAMDKESEAESVRKQIMAGTITFADAARKYSIDPYGRDNGGAFGWIVRGDDPIQKAAFALQKDGDISPVIKGRKGYEIIQRNAYQTAGVPPFEDVQKQIKEALTHQQVQRLAADMLDELRRATNVEQLVDFNSLNDDVRQILDEAKKSAQTGGAAPAASQPAKGK